MIPPYTGFYPRIPILQRKCCNSAAKEQVDLMDFPLDPISAAYRRRKLSPCKRGKIFCPLLDFLDVLGLRPFGCLLDLEAHPLPFR